MEMGGRCAGLGDPWLRRVGTVAGDGAMGMGKETGLLSESERVRYHVG